MIDSQSIEILIPNGNPNDLIVADMANWNAKAFKITYDVLSECHRKDANDPGVYLLFNEARADKHKTVYIGESMHVLQRLKNHASAFENGKEDIVWTDAVFFTSPTLNKSQIRYLEKTLVEIANYCNSYNVVTRAVCRNTSLTEAQTAAMDTFIKNIDTTLKTFGFHIFEKREDIDEYEMKKNNPDELLTNFGKMAAISALTGTFLPHEMLEDLTERTKVAIEHKDRDYLLSTATEFQLLGAELKYIEDHQTLPLGNETSIRANAISHMLKNIAKTSSWDMSNTLQTDLGLLSDAVERLELCELDIKSISTELKTEMQPDIF